MPGPFGALRDPVAMGSRRATARRGLGYFWHGRRGYVLAIVACSVVQAVLALAPVLVIKVFIDDLQRDSVAFAHIAVLLLAYGGLLIVGGLVGQLRTWLALTVRTQVVAQLRQQITDRLLAQSLSYFTRRRGGELMSRLLNDINLIDTLFEAAMAVISGVVTIAAVVVAMFVLEWHLALLSLVLVPPVVLTVRLGGRPVYRRRLQVQRHLADLTTQLQESLSLPGIMLIKSFGREESERTRITALNDGVRTSQVAAGMTAGWVGMVLNLLQFAGPAALMLAGAWLVTHGDLTLGTFAAFVTVLALQFAGAAARTGNGAVTVVGTLPAWDRVFELFDSTIDIVDRPDAIALVRARGAVRFDQVSFTYGERTTPALTEVTLDIAPGQLVAVVGPSGAGKSTLCSLVTRFYDPQQGVVRIDGHDVRSLTRASLGDVAGLVFQETYLFHGTLRDNLLYARPDATAGQLDQACRDAQLHEVVGGLPDGLDSVVGERGHRLSGGEKQRVAIARVMLKESRILVLDEATAHLDSHSEHLVQQALARLFRGRTSMVIAHRLSTVLAADLIVVLDRGRVVEQGTHGELLTYGGMYRSLYELQFRPGPHEPVPA